MFYITSDLCNIYRLYRTHDFSMYNTQNLYQALKETKMLLLIYRNMKEKEKEKLFLNFHKATRLNVARVIIWAH